MPFGLKNAGATYQRLMDKIFKDQIGKTLEVYVDDMVVKSDTPEQHAKDLEDIFQRIRTYGMRLNPEKCVFGVNGGKFLGFMLDHRGIQTNPDKCQAIIDMRSPKNVKEVQRFAGRLTSLSRFLPTMADKAKPILNLLKKKDKYNWTPQCEEAFGLLKQCLAAPPLLSKPDPSSDLLVYLAVSDEAISIVLAQDREGDQQPIYFVSRVLQDPETRYQLLEKVALALVYAARRLRQYFHGHRIVVKTDCAIAKILKRPELAGRMMTWSIELSEYDIRYEPRGPIKSQRLADFINELQDPQQNEDWWTLHVDGSSNCKGSGAGVILEAPSGLVFEQSLRFKFRTSNNQSEYEALIAGLKLAKEMNAQKLRCRTDSKVVAEQVKGTFQIKDENLLRYYHTVLRHQEGFDKIEIEHIPRSENTRADHLSKLASTHKPSHLHSHIQQTLEEPSIGGNECMASTSCNDDWRTHILNFLKTGQLPSDPIEAKRLRTQSARYAIIGDDLYKRGISTPLLKCLTSEDGNYVIRELHEGICGTHSGTRTMAAKVLRAGYYWPTLTADCLNFVKKCLQCQKHGNLIHAPAETLTTVLSPWPFTIWGMDIVGPFPPAKGQVKFLLVAVDYFTKWIEAEPLATITAQNVKKFLWKNIITRFGIPHAIVTDNGRQFTEAKLEDLMTSLGIQHRTTSVEHPQSNGQAESANKSLLNELKKRLTNAKGVWADIIPDILWGYRCTIHSATNETPFKLTYGTDAMIPVEVGEPSLRRQHFDPKSNEQALRQQIDLTDEVRDKAVVIAEACKQRMTRRINSKVKPRDFQEGDLVWRTQSLARKDTREGKLAANWDGPLRVKQNLHNGAYKLEDLAGKLIPRTWNSALLKFYYS